MSVGPSVLDTDVLAGDVSAFPQTLMESIDHSGALFRGARGQEADERSAALLSKRDICVEQADDECSSE